MSFSLIASGKFAGGVNGGTSGSINASGSDLCVIVGGGYFGSGSSGAVAITDSNGNSYTKAVGVKTASVGFENDIFYCRGTNFTNGMTITASGNDTYYSFCYEFWSGSAASSFLGGTNSHYGGSHASTLTTNSVTPDTNGSLVVAGLVLTDNQSGAPTIDSSMTQDQWTNWVTGTAEGSAVASLVQGTAGAINPTWSNLSGTLENAATIAWFRPAAGGATYTLTAAKGAFAHTGIAAALLFGRKVAAAVGTFAYSGVAASLTFGRLLTAAKGAFAVGGPAVSLRYSGITGYILTAARGLFALAGRAVSLARGSIWTMPASDSRDWTPPAPGAETWTQVSSDTETWTSE